jgi:hypothetical protein
MTAPKFTPAGAYFRCVRELKRLIDNSGGLSLDEITVESLRTAIHALETGPGLYEALDWYVKNDAVNDCPHNEFWLEGLDRAKDALAKARGEQP